MADWDGEHYSRTSDLQRTMATRAIDGLVLRSDDHLLDVGCGDGFVTRLLAARLPDGRAVGVDASPQMIAKAAATDDHVQFVLADVRDMPFDAEFDVVVSFNALHWVREQRRALGSIAAAARPGARVLIQMVCAGDRPSLETVAMEVAGSVRWVDRFAGFAPPFIHVDPDEYPDLAASSGLRVTELSVDDLTWDFGTHDEFADWCRNGSGAWTDHLQPGEREAFLEDWVRAYEEASGRAGLLRFTQMRVDLEVHR
ncbi:class I SAM-dependent methyltransferase [Rhodococcus sp. ACT016]|uniref:class I SAM-dependent methyltransferase n=1 Tax=Rhodococcus sp. ACT016 TaxID=3134808 RepID=UPI003D271335